MKKYQYEAIGNEVVATMGGLYKGTLKCLSESDANWAADELRQTADDDFDGAGDIADRISAEWVY